ncbi:MAG: aminodeoxychorismate/anthranilate synthase component II [Planctomycetaceae bacterium]
MILLIDNYDSFVYNLARYLEEMGCRTRVVRNDRVSVADVRALSPQAIVISPGPCTPQEAGISVALVRELGGEFPILGVCLGHQAIGAAFGAAIIRAPRPVHGRTSAVRHSGARLFAGLPNPLRAARYHSLLIDEATLPGELSITARSEDGLPMAVEHRTLPIFGVQFHPESVLTASGHRLLANFVELAGLPIAMCPDDEFSVAPPSADWHSETPLPNPPLRW